MAAPAPANVPPASGGGAASRRRREEDEEEDAAENKLGPVFIKAGALMLSEVAIAMSKKMEEEEESSTRRVPVFDKTFEYVKMFNPCKNPAAITQIRELLTKKALTEFEAAQLGNLCPRNAEEAKSLVPSLKTNPRMSDEELDQLLHDIDGYSTS